MSATADDGIETCVACGARLGTDSFAGFFVNAVGMAIFRVCPPCRDGADEQTLQRIRRMAEQQLLVTMPVEGHA